jgi:hypothetical protein
VIAKSGLSGDKKQRAISAPNPCSRIRGRHEGRDLVLREKLDRTMLAAFGWDRKNALALKTERGLTNCDESKERVDCCETGVPCPHGVAPVPFKMSKEFLDENPIQLVQQQFGRGPTKMLRSESQQQSEGVAVARHRIRADALLLQQALRKEAL